MKLKILFTSIIFLQYSTAVYPMGLPELTDIIDQGYVSDESTQDQDDESTQDQDHDLQEREKSLKRLRTNLENIREQQSIQENTSLLIIPEKFIPQPENKKALFQTLYFANKTLHFIEESIPTTQQKILDCPQPGCDKRFHSAYALKRHIDSKNCPWPKVTICSICHNPFSTPIAKDLHMQRIHYKSAHDSDRSCNKQSSADQTQMNKSCFRFSTYNRIQRISHKKSQEESTINLIAKYPCPNLGCEKQCRSPQALASHINSLSCPWVPHQVFTCPECPHRIFENPYGKEAHMKKKHPHGLPNQHIK